jgi:hypothetical protein
VGFGGGGRLHPRFFVGIQILDHVVVAADGFVSLADRGWQ